MRQISQYVRNGPILALGVCLLTATGCEQIQQGPSAEAVLRVRRQGAVAADYDAYRKTHAALLTSDFVLQAALRDQSLQQHKGLSVASLKNELRVDIPDNSELLRVRLMTVGRKPSDVEHILNRVLDSYLKEIVNKERLEQVDVLAKLRKRYSVLFDTINNKTDQVSELGRRIGVPGPSDLGIAQQTKRIDSMNQMLLELELDRVEFEHIGDESKLAISEKQIELLKAKLEEELKKLKVMQARAANWRLEKMTWQPRRDLAMVRAEMQKIEVALDGPRRVTVIQTATAQK